MADDKLTDEAQAQIREAIKIVREDKVWSALHGKAQAPAGDPPKDGPPSPPRKDEPAESDAPKKRGIWWREDDETPDPDPKAGGTDGA